uniref:Uncharacterized protein n=1 Tax=Mandrillus leucophaeus TaxID=9568 RepID=A0A2K5XMH9_MANLE
MTLPLSCSWNSQPLTAQKNKECQAWEEAGGWACPETRAGVWEWSFSSLMPILALECSGLQGQSSQAFGVLGHSGFPSQ